MPLPPQAQYQLFEAATTKVKGVETELTDVKSNLSAALVEKQTLQTNYNVCIAQFVSALRFLTRIHVQSLYTTYTETKDSAVELDTALSAARDAQTKVQGKLDAALDVSIAELVLTPHRLTPFTHRI